LYSKGKRKCYRYVFRKYKIRASDSYVSVYIFTKENAETILGRREPNTEQRVETIERPRNANDVWAGAGD